MIAPTENVFVSMVTGGEGWHNYHHTFPWDWKVSEFGYWCDNNTHLLHLFSKIGWAYDMKEPSNELVKSTVARKAAKAAELKSNDKP